MELNLSLENEIGEIWKDIPNYNGFYQVSNHGRVKSISRKINTHGGSRCNKCKILRLSINAGGYYSVMFSKYNVKKRMVVHQLVAICFLNHILNGFNLVINHVDGNKINNNPNNLEIVTQRYNTSDGFLRYYKESKYTGVTRARKRWRCTLTINKKSDYLSEYDAHLIYQLTIKNLDAYNGDDKLFREYIQSLPTA